MPQLLFLLLPEPCTGTFPHFSHSTTEEPEPLFICSTLLLFYLQLCLQAAGSQIT